jgi:hypothetical protein
MWLAQGSASESTIALITAKVATSPSVPAGLLFGGAVRRILPQARGFRLYRAGGPNNCRQRLTSDFKQLGRILAPHRLTDTFATVTSRVHVLDCEENCDRTAARRL